MHLKPSRWFQRHRCRSCLFSLSARFSFSLFPLQVTLKVSRLSSDSLELRADPKGLKVSLRSIFLIFRSTSECSAVSKKKKNRDKSQIQKFPAKIYFQTMRRRHITKKILYPQTSPIG